MRRQLIIGGLLTLSACATATSGKSGSGLAKAETSVAKALVSDQQENQIGDQVYSELVTKGTRFSSDPTVTGYIDSITSRLFPQAQKDRPNVNWRVMVIDDPKTVNAFSTPGGRLYVYSGLINAAANDAEIAGVMAHEIGHEAAHHIARSLVEANGLEAIAGLALGQKPGLVSQIAASVVGNGTMLAHSRSEETEADEYGARYSSAAGFDPQGLITFFQKLQQLQGNTPGFAKYLSDHPATTDRIDHLRQYIAANHLVGADHDATRIAQVKARLGGGAGSASSSGPASTGTPTHGDPGKPSAPPPPGSQSTTPAPSNSGVPVHHG
jgi:predicted Zn-dependent protease